VSSGGLNFNSLLLLILGVTRHDAKRKSRQQKNKEYSRYKPYRDRLSETTILPVGKKLAFSLTTELNFSAHTK